MRTRAVSCASLKNHSIFFLLLPWIDAESVPKNSRSNPRIFNCLEISAKALSASGRETGSNWNTRRLQANRLPGSNPLLFPEVRQKSI
jgi:hypothetical protein